VSARWRLPLGVCLGLGLRASEARAGELSHWTLDSDDGGFVSGGDTLQWEWGAPSTGPAVEGTEGSSEPTWATVLDGNYLHDSLDWLRLPPGSLTNSLRPLLGIRSWMDIEPDGDVGYVEIWDGLTWQRAEPIYGYPSPGGFTGESEGWVTTWWDLSGVADSSFVRLVFSSNPTVSRTGWYIDDVVIEDGDPVPPTLTITVAPSDTDDLDGPYPIGVSVEDDVAVTGAVLTLSVDGAAPIRSALVPPPLGSTEWSGTIPGMPPDTTLTWTVEATDGVNTTTSAPQSFRVALPAPTDLRGPEGRVVARTAALSWTPPESSHRVTGYRVYRDGEPLIEVTAPETEAALVGPEDRFTVNALFATGADSPLEGDPSGPLVIEAAVPVVRALEPASAWQGDQLRLRLTGEHLLLEQDAVSLDLGEGITVLSVEVENVDLVTFTLRVEHDAPVGARVGAVESGAGVVPLDLPFTVEDGADRPALQGVEPEAVSQGEEVELRLRANRSLNPTGASVDLGPGLLVTTLRAEGDEIIIGVVVENTAPVGLRDIVFDDGTRLYEGVQLRVRDRAVAGEAGCGCTTQPPGGALRLFGLSGAALLLLRRRRRVTAP
jgi:MYXO-CTERM domain-containing protein